VKPNPDGSEDPILCPGTTLETLFVDGFYTEGPAVGPDGRIYFCDITPTFLSNMAAGNIWAYNPTDGSTTLIRSPSGMASGIQFDAAGRMVIAGGADFGCRSIIRTDLKTGRSHILAGLYTGKHFNSPNDLVIDRNGRIYFTDPRYFGHEPIEQPVFGVYRIDPDGSVHLLLADCPTYQSETRGRCASLRMTWIRVSHAISGHLWITAQRRAPTGLPLIRPVISTRRSSRDSAPASASTPRAEI
jgi:hypothetical protein